jgi:hypothetical protein
MSYLPHRDGPLLNWSSNFNQLVSVNFALYGLSQQQAEEYDALHQIYLLAFQTATHPPSRTTPSIGSKNVAKKALMSKARELVRIIQAHPGTTTEMRLDLNITVPDDVPTPVPPPAHPPLLLIGDRYQRTVEVMLRDSKNPESKARPDGVSGATVFSWVGEQPPADITMWKFEGNTSKTQINVTFPFTVPPASQVWFTAFWFNPTKESGPASNPVNAYLDSGMNLEMNMDGMSEAA